VSSVVVGEISLTSNSGRGGFSLPSLRWCVPVSPCSGWGRVLMMSTGRGRRSVSGEILLSPVAMGVEVAWSSVLVRGCIPMVPSTCVGTSGRRSSMYILGCSVVVAGFVSVGLYLVVSDVSFSAQADVAVFGAAHGVDRYSGGPDFP
jgi:hypothetical protein